MKYYSIFFVTFVLSYILYAGTAIDLFDGSVGIRNLAMGGAGVAFSEGSVASAYNPAGLALDGHSSLTSETFSIFNGELSRFSLNASTALGKGVAGFNFIQEGVNGIPLVRDDGTNQPQQYGSFNSASRVFNLAYGMTAEEGISWVGATLKFLSTDLSTANATGFGLDAGILYAIDENFQVGLSIKNILGGQMKWNTGHADDLSLTITSGLASSFSLFSNPLILAVDVALLSQNHGASLWGGLEYQIWQSPEGKLLLRMGRNRLEQLTYGLGVVYNGFQCDYTYDNDDLGGLSAFGFGFQF